MELVIKIPEEIRLALINNVQLSIDQQSICDSYIKQAIVNGTPLPKGHGRLIDADKFINDFACFEYIEAMNVDYFRAVVQTIIEADGGNAE